VSFLYLLISLQNLTEKNYFSLILGIPMEEEHGKPKEFTPSKGLTTFEAQQLLQKWGRNELEDKKKSKVKKISPACFSPQN
jgi:hypothetical protein